MTPQYGETVRIEMWVWGAAPSMASADMCVKGD
jgi:hypothetical protein